MSIYSSLREKFPQIKILSSISELEAGNPLVKYSCAFHDIDKEDKLNALMRKNSCCTKCSMLTHKGHVFNRDGKPLESKKIRELISIFDGKFDYSKFMSTDTTTPSTISCKKHGEFSMSIKDHVLVKDQLGCPHCVTEGTRSSIKDAVSTEKAMLANSLANIETESHTSPTVSQKPVTNDWLSKAKSLFSKLAC